jgi:predicted transcriptional regulator
MPLPKLSKLELQIMDALWKRGPCSVREIQESIPAKKRPAYTTVQTMVYRLEVKKALRRVKKIATANIFEAAVSREAAQRRLVDELLGLFGGRSRPIMAHLIESGSLTLEDVRDAERTLLKLAGEEDQK